MSLMDMRKKIFLVISVDVEIDKSPNWSISKNETFISVLKGIPWLLTPIFEKYYAKPTYLLSPEVIENTDCVKVIKNLKNCEIGTHLHGDVIEPRKRIKRLACEQTRDMQCFYTGELEFQKMKNLTELFLHKFGSFPKSFRAGRFAASSRTINFLEKLGYTVDSSVTPGIYWKDPEGVVNFLGAPCQPYFPSRKNLLEHGDSKILEVPLTIVAHKFNRYLRPLEGTKVLKPFRVIAKNIFRTYWLQPSLESLNRMIKICEISIDRTNRNIVVLNMMFHSVEVVPCASPYSRSKKEVNTFLQKIEGILRYASERGFIFATLSELYPIFRNVFQNE